MPVRMALFGIGLTVSRRHALRRREPPLQRPVSRSGRSVKPDVADSGCLERQSCNGLAQEHDASGMAQNRFMAHTAHAVIPGKRGQHGQEIVRRPVRKQFRARLRARRKPQNIPDDVGGLSGAEEGAAEKVSGNDAKPNEALRGLSRVLPALVGQRTRAIVA